MTLEQQEKLYELIEQMLEVIGSPNGREVALVRTKIEEAKLWLTQVVSE